MAKAKGNKAPAKAKPNPRNKQLYDDGMKVRKAVLGADYVDNSMASADDFMMSFQDVTTEYCWGYVWTRPGLPKKTRSMLNLAMLAALNRSPELKLHVNGALNNGLSKEEIKEVFLQVAIYCGIPAGLDAFKTARDVFKERGLCLLSSPVMRGRIQEGESPRASQQRSVRSVIGRLLPRCLPPPVSSPASGGGHEKTSECRSAMPRPAKPQPSLRSACDRRRIGATTPPSCR
jgi:4-carboxymuconolactone decarboxylase